MNARDQLAAIMTAHFIDITVTNPDRIGACACGTWTGGSESISWDEHLADAILAAGYVRAEGASGKPNFWDDWERCPKRHGHAAHILDCTPEQDQLGRIPTYKNCATCGGGGCGDCV